MKKCNGCIFLRKAHADAGSGILLEIEVDFSLRKTLKTGGENPLRLLEHFECYQKVWTGIDKNWATNILLINQTERENHTCPN